MSDTLVLGRAARAFAWLVLRLRWPIVVAWVAGAVAATLYLPGLGESGAPLSGLIPENAAAVEAQRRSSELFSVPLVTDTAIVQRRAAGLSQDAQERVFERAAAVQESGSTGLAFALPVTNTRGLVPGSREQGTAAVTFLYFGPDASISDKDALAHDYASQAAGPDDGLVGVTGALPARLAEFHRIEDALPYVEIATVALIALILALTFRSVGAPLVTLFAAGIAYLVTVRVVSWLGEQAGVAVPREIEPLVVVLLLGIVTDYAIFFLSGLRARLTLGEQRLEAAERSTAQYLPIVFTAGLIVAAGAAALLAGRIEFFRALGPGLALTALCGLLVSVTLIPALLGIFGRWLLWPGRHAPLVEEEPVDEAPAALPEPDRRGWRYRLAHFATARATALLIVLLVGGALVVAASGLRKTDLGFTNVSGLPADSEPRVAAEAAAKGFAPGILAPTEVVLEQPGIAGQRAELERLEALVERREGVAGVVGPREEPASVRTGAVVSEDGNAARLAVILDEEPLGGPAIDRFEELRAAMPALLRESGVGRAQVIYAGQTALAAETVSETVSDLKRIAIAGLCVNFLLLALFLRSLVAPLFLLGASVLAVAATLGLTTYVFEDLLGYGELTYYVPFAAAVLLVALGSDYNVYVVGQVWDEASRRPLRDAIATAVPRASRTISVAGIALALSFALLAIVPLRAFRELAFTLCVGVLIDAFVVRSMLVPALVSLFGNASWWPGRRIRRRSQPAAALPETAAIEEPSVQKAR
jgi:RND superfamily putative drug exporter